MPKVHYLWFENQSDLRIAICQIAAGNEAIAIRRAKTLLDKPDEYVYVRSDVGNKKLLRLADHQNNVGYFNAWTLPDEPEWIRYFRKALTYGDAGDDLIDGSAVKVETILSSIRHAVAPEPLWNIDSVIMAELVRLIHEFCEIRPWTWNDPEEQDTEGSDLPCIIHLDVPGHSR